MVPESGDGEARPAKGGCQYVSNQFQPAMDCFCILTLFSPRSLSTETRSAVVKLCKESSIPNRGPVEGASIRRQTEFERGNRRIRMARVSLARRRYPFQQSRRELCCGR